MGSLPWPVRISITPLGDVLLAALVVLLLRRRRTVIVEREFAPDWDIYPWRVAHPDSAPYTFTTGTRTVWTQ